MTKKTEAVNTEATEVTTEVAVTEEVMLDLTGFDFGALDFSEEELKALTGLENIKSTDISIPFATLIAKDTTTTAKGDLVLPGAETLSGWQKGEVLEGVSILNIQPVRVYFPTPYKATNSFICRSLDGEVGSEDSTYAGRSCATCEFSKYPEDGGASPCRDQRLLLLATDSAVFQFVVSGVGMKEFRAFLTQQMMTILPRVKGLLPALRFDVEIGRVETDNGPFPYLNFKLSKKPLNEAHRTNELLGMLKSYKEFSAEHAKSAATATQVEEAIANRGEEVPEEAGENKNLF